MRVLITSPFLFQILDNALKLENRNVFGKLTGSLRYCLLIDTIQFLNFLLGGLGHCQFYLRS